jgi:hypothetical protein
MQQQQQQQQEQQVLVERPQLKESHPAKVLRGRQQLLTASPL